ncbi:MAG: contractile injection system tape measure protein [Bacteroidia bacterium]
MPGQVHKIGRQVLELVVPQEPGVRQVQDAFRDLYYARLLPVLEKVLDDMVPPDRMIRLDHLELNLGRTGWDLSPEHLEEQLELQLRQQMEEVLKSAESNEPRSLGEYDSGDADWNFLMHYLVYGDVPEWLSPVDFHPEAQLVRLLRSADGPQLALLKKVMNLPTVLLRLAWTMSEATRLLAVERLLGARSEAVLQIHRDLARMHGQRPLLPMDAGMFALRLWESSLSMVPLLPELATNAVDILPIYLQSLLPQPIFRPLDRVWLLLRAASVVPEGAISVDTVQAIVEMATLAGMEPDAALAPAKLSDALVSEEPLIRDEGLEGEHSPKAEQGDEVRPEALQKTRKDQVLDQPQGEVDALAEIQPAAQEELQLPSEERTRSEEESLKSETVVAPTQEPFSPEAQVSAPEGPNLTEQRGSHVEEELATQISLDTPAADHGLTTVPELQEPFSAQPQDDIPPPMTDETVQSPPNDSILNQPEGQVPPLMKDPVTDAKNEEPRVPPQNQVSSNPDPVPPISKDVAEARESEGKPNQENELPEENPVVVDRAESESLSSEGSVEKVKEPLHSPEPEIPGREVAEESTVVSSNELPAIEEAPSTEKLPEPMAQDSDEAKRKALSEESPDAEKQVKSLQKEEPLAVNSSERPISAETESPESLTTTTKVEEALESTDSSATTEKVEGSPESLTTTAKNGEALESTDSSATTEKVEESPESPGVPRSAEEESIAERFRRFREQWAQNPESLIPRTQTEPLHIPWRQNDPKHGMGVLYAGLVIAWPYIGPLFKRLEWLEKREFVSPEAQFAAVHLLRYVATGTVGEVQDHELGFCKVMAGLHPTDPVPTELGLTEAQYAAADEMVDAIIVNWGAVKRTSRAGLRQTFLQRAGNIRSDENGWIVHLERETMDILLDRIPWGFSTIRLGWQSRMIFVQW